MARTSNVKSKSNNPRFRLLFSPIRVGSLTLRNRIVNTAHGTGFTKDHVFTDQHVHYYAERAKGGVAMIITESASVHPTSNIGMQDTLRGYERNILPSYRRVADAVHRHGTKVLVQLSHQGRQGGTVEGLPRWGASPIPSRESSYGNNEVPHEMDTEEIAELVGAFAECAALAKEGGFDGVELHGAHGNLIHQFLSPLTNLRADEYGGGLDNRLRFATEVVNSVRGRVGREFVVGMRISGDEFVPGGLDLEQMKVVARRLTAGGLLDYLNVSNSTYSDLGSMANHMPSMYYLPAQFSHIWKGIKDAVAVPVLGMGRINSPELAENLLSEGKADLIGMVRELIADPRLPEKARSGVADKIRPCIGCMQSCIGRRTKGLYITCIHNPVTGREREWSEIAPASASKSVLVVGGGPGGLEAAKVAARRGHRVTLLEKSSRLGGQTLTASRGPMRGQFAEIASFAEAEACRAGVDIRFNEEATIGSVLEFGADVVVVATGSEGYVGMECTPSGPELMTAQDVLDGNIPSNRNVVVVDTQGVHSGSDVSEVLLDHGNRVEMVTTAPYAGANLQPMVWRVIYERLLNKGLEVSPFTVAVGLGEGSVTLRSTVTGREENREGVDTVVFADNRRALDGLYKGLKGRVAELYAVGDCLAPRTVEQAMYEGHKVGRGI